MGKAALWACVGMVRFVGGYLWGGGFIFLVMLLFSIFVFVFFFLFSFLLLFFVEIDCIALRAFGSAFLVT